MLRPNQCPLTNGSAAVRSGLDWQRPVNLLHWKRRSAEAGNIFQWHMSRAFDGKRAFATSCRWEGRDGLRLCEVPRRIRAGRRTSPGRAEV